MLDVREKEIILHIIDHCERIIENVKEIDFETYERDRNIQDIILFNIFQIGELSKSLSNEFIQKYNAVPWKNIKGMRDVIGHGYQSINSQRIYDTAKKDIYYLYDYCKSLEEN